MEPSVVFEVARLIQILGEGVIVAIVGGPRHLKKKEKGEKDKEGVFGLAFAWCHDTKQTQTKNKKGARGRKQGKR